MRNKAQREADLEMTALLYLKGKTQLQIAQAVGVSRSQIFKDLRSIFDRWRRSAIRNFDDAKVEELAKIDNMEREAWKAWEKSLQPRERTLTERRTKGDGTTKDGAKARVERTDGLGDSRYLERVAWCITKRCEILGLNAPQKIAPTDPTGRQPFVLAARMMTDEELRTIANMRAIADKRREDGDV